MGARPSLSLVRKICMIAQVHCMFTKQAGLCMPNRSSNDLQRLRVTFLVSGKLPSVFVQCTGCLSPIRLNFPHNSSGQSFWKAENASHHWGVRQPADAAATCTRRVCSHGWHQMTYSHVFREALLPPKQVRGSFSYRHITKSLQPARPTRHSSMSGRACLIHCRLIQ